VIKVGRLSTKCALHHEPGTQMVKDLGDETQKCLRVNHIVNQEGTIFWLECLLVRLHSLSISCKTTMDSLEVGSPKMCTHLVNLHEHRILS
jgi:hypothetical protein